MILPIFFLIFSLAHSHAVNVEEISDNKDLWNLNPKFKEITDLCQATTSLYELYSIFTTVESNQLTEEMIRDLKFAIVKRFTELHSTKNLAETLKELIIRKDFIYAHFYCWALTKQNSDFSIPREFENDLESSIVIENYILTQIEDMCEDPESIDLHVMGLMIKFVNSCALVFCRGYTRKSQQQIGAPLN
jgi:hypothetical protein